MTRERQAAAAEHLRRFEVEAGPVLEQLAAVRSAQTYCREAELVKRAAPWRVGAPIAPEGPSALDVRERDLIRRLADLRASFGIVVH